MSIRVNDKNVDFHKTFSENIKQYVIQKRLILKKCQSVGPMSPYSIHFTQNGKVRH